MSVGTQDADALTAENGARDLLQNHSAFIGGFVTKTSPLYRHHRVGQMKRFFEFEGEVGCRHHGGNLLHALQRFDPALSLFGFAGLGFESVDEVLQVRDLVLLLFKGRLLQDQFLRS